MKQLCSGGKTFTFNFILAAVAWPILDMGFLAQHKLQVDAAASRVLLAVSVRPRTPDHRFMTFPRNLIYLNHCFKCSIHLFLKKLTF
jgi:hypothetical protein